MHKWSAEFKQALVHCFTFLFRPMTLKVAVVIFSYTTNMRAAVSTVCSSLASRPLYRPRTPYLLWSRKQPISTVSHSKKHPRRRAPVRSCTHLILSISMENMFVRLPITPAFPSPLYWPNWRKMHWAGPLGFDLIRLRHEIDVLSHYALVNQRVTFCVT